MVYPLPMRSSLTVSPARKNLKAVGAITGALAGAGVATLRFDFTGLGESEGDSASTDFTTNVSDLAAAVDYMEATREGPKILIGHSLGGAAVLAAAPGLGTVKAVATIGAPASPSHVRALFGGSSIRSAATVELP